MSATVHRGTGTATGHPDTAGPTRRGDPGHPGAVIWVQLLLAALVLAGGVALLTVGALLTGGIVAVLGGMWVGACVRRL